MIHLKKLIIKLILVLLGFLTSCNKGSSNELTLSIESGENGMIRVVANADGAVSYRFSFEEGNVFNNASGLYEYSYERRGTYTIGVWAFFDSQNEDFTYEVVEIEITNAATEPQTDEEQNITQYEGYTLVWNDEFDYEGIPLESKWHLQYIPLFNGGWANNEEQHYTNRAENAFVSNGTLKIIAKRETYTFEGSQKNYTSARLNSKFDMQYGRIDVSAKLPTETGTWPAIWTLGTNINEYGNYHGDSAGSVGWPACGEIDIMEQNGWDKTNVIGHFHWADTTSSEYMNYGDEQSTTSLEISDLTTNFHLYSLVWSSDSMEIFVDNKSLVQMDNTESSPYDNPHYLLLNIAMGGTLGGDILEAFNQAEMEIDYVRFYQ